MEASQEISVEKIEKKNEILSSLTNQENRVKEVEKKNRIQKMLNAYPKANVSLIQSLDPSSNNKYIMWIASQLDSGHTSEDIGPTIKLFMSSQDRLNKNERDIYSFEDLKDLEDRLKDLGSSKRSSNQVSKENAIHMGKHTIGGSVYKLVRVKDKESSAFYGKGTRWCITMQNADYFDQYEEKNNFFYFLLRESVQDNNLDKIAIVIEKNINYSSAKAEDFNGIALKKCQELISICENDCGGIELGIERPDGRVSINDDEEELGYKFYRIDDKKFNDVFKYEAVRVERQNNETDIISISMRRNQNLKVTVWNSQDHQFEPSRAYDDVINICKKDCNNEANTFGYNLSRGHLSRLVFLENWSVLRKDYGITDEDEAKAKAEKVEAEKAAEKV